jgi:phage baseplate assembly protein gpV
MEQTVQQQIKSLENRVTELECIIRIGTVISVNSSKRTVRVSWGKMQSADLRCLTTGTWADAKGKLTNWMPKVGNKVVSIHRVNGQGDGYILGVL